MRTRAALLTLLTTAAVARAVDPLPTADELQVLLEAKKWNELSAAASRVLTLKGPAAEPYDRVDVWMKKGEAQLQGNQFAPAAQSFAKAAEETKATPEQKDYAKALSELAKKSDIKGYKTPVRLGAVKTFDVKVTASRPEAFAALLSVNVADMTQRVDAAKAVTERKPLVDLAEQSTSLASLDRVVNKSTDQSDAVQKRLAQNFVAAATTFSKGIDDRVDKIQETADEEVEQRVRDNRGQITIQKVRRGSQPRDLQDSMDMIGQARKWAETYTGVKAALGAAGQAEIQPAEPVIQAAFDRAKSVQSMTKTAKPKSGS